MATLVKANGPAVHPRRAATLRGTTKKGRSYRALRDSRAGGARNLARPARSVDPQWISVSPRLLDLEIGAYLSGIVRRRLLPVADALAQFARGAALYDRL